MERSTTVGTDLLAWVPPSIARSRRRLVLGSWVLGSALGVAAMFAWSSLHLPVLLSIGLLSACTLITGPGAELLTRWSANRLAMRRLRGCVTEAPRLRALSALSDGELVRVQGTISFTAQQAERSALPAGVAFLRQVAKNRIRERATDFSLVDDEAGEVHIVVADARLVRASGEPWGATPCTLRVGDRVEVLGRKTRVVDAMQSERLERQEPIRTALTGSRDLPLVLIPLGPAQLSAPDDRRTLPAPLG